MKYLFFLLFILAFFQIKEGKSQCFDDFSDGNLDQDPLWLGDTLDFIIDEDRLRLNASQEGLSSIFTQIYSDSNTFFEWRFELELDFSPSTNNRAIVVLYSEDSLFWTTNATFNDPVYLLSFGESGSSDAVELQRIDSATAVPIIICRGEDGLIASSFRRNYKVKYFEGEWEISSGMYYSPYMYIEANGVDTLFFPLDGYFGFQFDYTSSHVNDIYIDNISCGTGIIDSVVPSIDSVEVVNAFELYLSFSEPTDSIMLDPLNYTLQNPFSHPLSVDFLDSFQTEIRLAFSTEFSPWTYSILTIDSLLDIENNLNTNQYIEFVYSPLYEAQPGEIRFNEIMPDPTPSVGMPDVEFIELINVCDSAVELASYSIQNSGNPMFLPSFLLQANSFVILCKDENAELFTNYGDVIGISNWVSLLNTGDSLLVLNKSGDVLDQLNYSASWFDDPLKKEGGWSLERINANINCNSEINWKESKSLYGGTAGLANSVIDIALENKIDLNQAYIVDSTLLRVEIAGEMDTSLFIDLMYSTSPPFQIDFENSFIDGSGLLLSCFPSFQTDISYHITFHNLYDCRGIVIPDQEMIVGFPEPGEVGDIVINEILFNPYTGGSDFIEIYNRSSKFIDLKNWRIVELYNDIPIEDARISDRSLLIAPNELIAMSSNIEELPMLYSYFDRSQLFRVNDLPNFSNDEGEVIIVNSDFTIIDSLKYAEEMHFSLLDDFNGVSLERIHPDRPSYENSTWISTSENVGFATPGYMNSHFLSNNKVIADLYLEPQLFTPNNDGDKDVLYIHYNLEEEGGWMVNVTVYNDRGEFIKNIAENRWIEKKGVFRWDGLNSDDEEANVGIYIVYFEAFNDKGKKTILRKVCVLGKAIL